MAASRIGEIFNEGAAQFEAWTSLLWGPVGEETTRKAHMTPGDHVLDVCCGSGASALPAARAVGATGKVDAIDLAAGLLERGRAKAAAENLRHLTFSLADATTWPPPDRPYDVVQCVFGIFFLPEMDASARTLIRLLRPGGRFVVTTWAENSLSALSHALREALARQGRTLERTPPSEAMDRINSPERLGNWLRALHLGEIAVDTLTLELPLNPESAWNFVLGTGKRRVLADLNDRQQRQLRSDFTAELRDVDGMTATTLIGVGRRPEPPWDRDRAL